MRPGGTQGDGEVRRNSDFLENAACLPAHAPPCSTASPPACTGMEHVPQLRPGFLGLTPVGAPRADGCSGADCPYSPGAELPHNRSGGPPAGKDPRSLVGRRRHDHGQWAGRPLASTRGLVSAAAGPGPPGLLGGELDEATATRHVLALGLELACLRRLEQTFGPAVAEAVRDNVEVSVAAAEQPRLCASCGASGTAAVLPVFEVDRRCAAEWRLCAPCWRHLTVGLTAGRPGGALEHLTAFPWLPLTDVEVRGYIAAGRGVVRRRRKRL